MAVDKDMVKQVAFLSRLKVNDDKMEDTKDEFNKIMNWIEQLNEVNTDNIDPLICVNQTPLVCRKDEVTQGNQSAEVLKNSPMSEFGYFVVPKVVE